MPPNPTAKRQPILQSAAGVFLRTGYAGARMDSIADAAAVSKVTLYNQFGSKQALFAALIRARCEPLLEIALQTGAGDTDPRAGLTHIARAYVRVHYAPESLELFRLAIAEQATFPDMAQLVFQSCQEPIQRRLADYLAQLNSCQLLRVSAPNAAARQFLAMLTGEPHLRCLLGLQAGLSADERDTLIHSVVTLFCQSYGSGAGTPAADLSTAG